jgi:hypothetical protein
MAVNESQPRSSCQVQCCLLVAVWAVDCFERLSCNWRWWWLLLLTAAVEWQGSCLQRLYAFWE